MPKKGNHYEKSYISGIVADIFTKFTGFTDDSIHSTYPANFIKLIFTLF